ncbi:MAG TPA: adenylate/guanylate cyclase domain-containing protein [Pseudolabrys sp.]
MHQPKLQRRLAAVLMADVVGYCRLIGQDERGTLRRIKAAQREVVEPNIAEYHGRVVRTIGDGLLIEYPSTVEAVGCAVAVQRTMAERNVEVSADQRIELRIGVHQGDIVVDDQDIFGDGVNVAARLEPLSEPGGICISGRVYEDLAGRLELPFQDGGERELKNIARSVHVFCLGKKAISEFRTVPSLEDGPNDPARFLEGRQTSLLAWLRRRWKPSGLRPVLKGRPTKVVSLISLLLIIAGAGVVYWHFHSTGPPASAHRLSIVVLPFTNLSAEPGQDYFADGITEDLTADLARIAGSFVIAPNTARAYKNVDPKRTGSELGVRYVLDGSVRRTETMVRINAHLIDAQTTSEIWSERFDGEWTKSMQLQDIITGRLARRLDLELTNEESRRAEIDRPNNPDAVDLAMRGWAVLNQPYSREQLAQSRALFEHALQIDPGLPKALVGLADALAIEVNYRWSDAPADQLRRAEDTIGRVLSVSASDAMAHFVKGEIQRAKGRNIEIAVNEYETAIALNPSLAPAYGALGGAKIRVGRSAEAFAPLQKAIQLSPRDPLLNTWYFYICHAHTHLAQFKATVDWCLRSIAVKPFWIAYADLAASYAWTGRESEAQSAVAELRKMKPNYTVTQWLDDGNGWSDNPIFLAEFQRIAEGLRKAGLPEK